MKQPMFLVFDPADRPNQSVVIAQNDQRDCYLVWEGEMDPSMLMFGAPWDLLGDADCSFEYLDAQ